MRGVGEDRKFPFQAIRIAESLSSYPAAKYRAENLPLRGTENGYVARMAALEATIAALLARIRRLEGAWIALRGHSRERPPLPWARSRPPTASNGPRLGSSLEDRLQAKPSGHSQASGDGRLRRSGVGA